MRIAVPTLTEICLVAAGLVIFALVGVLVFDADDAEMICITVGVLTPLLFIGWGLFVYYPYWREMLRTVALVFAILIPIGLISVLFLDDDGSEIALGIVGVLTSIEITGWGLYALLRYQPSTLTVYLQIVGGIVLAILINLGFFSVGVGVGIAGDMLFLLSNGWAVYAFLRNRQGRQHELGQLLAAAVQGGVPLAPAVRSFARERPRRGKFWQVLVVLAHIALPLFTYVRIWIGWRSYDRLLEQLAQQIEAGDSLSAALRMAPGVSNRELRLAAAIGEATGALGPRLRDVGHERWAAAWLEIAPRLIYPFVLLLFAWSITTFLMVNIYPRFMKIFDDFHFPLPLVTRTIADVWGNGEEWAIAAIAIKCGLIAIALLVAKPAVRWHVPVLGRLYRWGVQAEILRGLGGLLEAGWTVPDALGFLRGSSDLPEVVKRRLGLAYDRVEQGDSLVDALERAELLPASMGPLVRAAQRTRTLPWALSELGNHLAGRAFRLVRRISLVVSPLLVVAVGAFVALIALGMFLPLIELLTRLVE